MHRGKGMKFVGDSRVSAVKKPNIPKDYSEYPGKTEAFWPNFLLKEWMVGSVFLVGYLCLTIAHPSPLERIADPTDTSYIPLPDWYFLFLYQLLKFSYASGPYTVIGAFIIPGLSFGALLLAPWLDAGPERRPFQRPIATSLMFLAFASIVYLTWDAVAHHDWEKAAKQGAIVKVAALDTNAEGYKLLQSNTCLSCHGNNLEGKVGPALAGSGLTAEEVMNIAKKGKGSMPAGVFKGTDAQLKTLADFVAQAAKK